MSHTGLAWFARQIPTEGFSDLSQGRLHEKEIPHSDQWTYPESESAQGKRETYRPDKFNKKQVLKGKNNGRGVSRILIDEIYQAKEYKTNKAAHNATYENGKFVFSYPAAWQNSGSVNKMIAVRRIETKPNDYLLDFNLSFTEFPAIPPQPFNIQIPSYYNIQEALSTIKLEIGKNTAFRAEKIYFAYKYDPSSTTVQLTFGFGVTGGSTYQHMKLTFVNDDFFKLFNIPLKDKARLADGSVTAYSIAVIRPRERQDLFLHASFVGNTTANYLGRSGEFYPSPSKMYPDDGQSYFYIETSIDGYNRIPLEYDNWILELTFIIDSEEYLG
jgi:hypothetical protein